MAEAQYRNTVLLAFQNVADALRALQLDAATLKAQQRAVRAASDTFDLTRGQYRLGAITYIILLNAQRSYQQALLALVQAQAARYADTAALFQALGGGWWNRVDVVPDPLSPEATKLVHAASDADAAAQQRSAVNDQTHGDHAGRGRRRVRRDFRIPDLQRHDDQEVHQRAEQSAADRLGRQGRYQRMAAEDRGDRHRCARSRAPICRSKFPAWSNSISFNSGDDVAAGAPLLKLRTADDVARLQSLQGDGRLERNHLRARPEAVQDAGGEPGDARYRRGQSEKRPARRSPSSRPIIDKKLLRAPFAGHLGIRAVDLGQYLGPGTVIVTLQALDPIFVDFFVPQQSVDQVRLGQPVTVKIDAFKDQTFTGEISAINPKVDLGSRNVQVRATLKNPDHKLLPGMYATVEIATGAPKNYVTLPQTAITYNPYGDTVYIVDSKDKDADGKPQLIARQTFVTVGPTRGDQVAVLKGVDDGDMIVTAGQIKLHNGSIVMIDNSDHADRRRGAGSGRSLRPPP